MKHYQFSQQILTLIAFTLISSVSYANVRLTYGVENFSPHIGQVQIDESGGTNFFDLNLGFNTGFSFSSSLFPSISYFPNATIFLPSSTEDDLLSKISGEINFHLLKKFLAHSYFLFGISYQLNYIYGDGGMATLNNGYSTASYYIPASSNLSHQFTPEVGFLSFLSPSLSYGINFMSHSPFSSLKRTFSFSINLNFWPSNAL